MRFAEATNRIITKTEESILVDNARVIVYKCTPPLYQGVPLWEEEPFVRIAIIPKQSASVYANTQIPYHTEIKFETPTIFGKSLSVPSKRYTPKFLFLHKKDSAFYKEDYPLLMKNIEALLPSMEEMSF